jgi:NAD(P)-dependent dehydrogenase (short-subunit alcohol dehydrogenase family)
VQSLAVEWAPKVRVVAVSPGLVRTEQSELHYGDEAGIASIAQTIPMNRLADSSDIGAACLWVASAQASYLSGSNLTLHGGGERPAFLAAASVNQT